MVSMIGKYINKQIAITSYAGSMINGILIEVRAEKYDNYIIVDTSQSPKTFTDASKIFAFWSTEDKE